MSARLFNRYIWLVDVIYSAGRISLEEINRRWARSVLNENHECQIARRTFANWRNEVEELFHIRIACDKHTNMYYIDNVSDITLNNLRRWLLNTFSVSQLLHDCKDMRDRILLEDISPSARFLTIVLESMRTRRRLRIVYQRFGIPEAREILFAPYCIKAFKQRWYMVGLSSDHPSEIRVYALDRVHDIEVSEEMYTIPKDFDGEVYFAHSYGVFVTNEDPEIVRIRTNKISAYYIRSLPLHRSQREIEETDTYSIFEYFLVPTIDFIQELRTHGAAIEVLAPSRMVEAFRQMVCEYKALYKI